MRFEPSWPCTSPLPSRLLMAHLFSSQLFTGVGVCAASCNPNRKGSKALEAATVVLQGPGFGRANPQRPLCQCALTLCPGRATRRVTHHPSPGSFCTKCHAHWLHTPEDRGAGPGAQAPAGGMATTREPPGSGPAVYWLLPPPRPQPPQGQPDNFTEELSRPRQQDCACSLHGFCASGLEFFHVPWAEGLTL